MPEGEGHAAPLRAAARVAARDVSPAPAAAEQGAPAPAQRVPEAAVEPSPATSVAGATKAKRRTPRHAPVAAAPATVSGSTPRPQSAGSAPVAQLRADRSAAPAAARAGRRTGLAGKAERGEAAPSPASAFLSSATPASPIAQSGIVASGRDARDAASPQRVARIGRLSRETTAPPPLEPEAVAESPPKGISRPAGGGAAHASDVADRAMRLLPDFEASVAGASAPVAAPPALEAAHRERPAAQAKFANTAAPTTQHVHESLAPPERRASPAAFVAGQTMPERLRRIEASAAAPAGERRESAASPNVSSQAASRPVATAQRRSLTLPPLTKSRPEHGEAAAGPTRHRPMHLPATQARAPEALEHAPQQRQAGSDRTSDRLVRARPRGNEHPEAPHARGAEHFPAAGSFADARRRYGAQAAAKTAAAANEIHIDIGRIQIELPRAQAPRARPEPPALQGKPRGGPDG